MRLAISWSVWSPVRHLDGHVTACLDCRSWLSFTGIVPIMPFCQLKSTLPPSPAAEASQPALPRLPHLMLPSIILCLSGPMVSGTHMIDKRALRECAPDLLRVVPTRTCYSAPLPELTGGGSVLAWAHGTCPPPILSFPHKGGRDFTSPCQRRGRGCAPRWRRKTPTSGPTGECVF
jgi:hypothetical protein